MRDGHTRNHKHNLIQTQDDYAFAMQKYNFRICKVLLKKLKNITLLKGHDTHTKTCEYLNVLDNGEYDIHNCNEIILTTLLSKYELANAPWIDPITINYIDNKFYCHPGTSRLSYFEFYPDKAVDVMLWGDECELDEYRINSYYRERPFELLYQEMYQERHKKYVKNLQWISMYNLDYFANNEMCKITDNEIYLDDKKIYKIIDDRWHIKVPSGWFSFDQYDCE